MAGFFVWSEPRLCSTGFKDTFVVSIGTKSKAICRRQDKAEAERLRVKLEASKLTTVPELKDFLKKLLLEVRVCSSRSSPLQVSGSSRVLWPY